MILQKPNKEILRTSAFPRSGSTFLNYALKSLYFAEDANTNFHTIKSIDKYEKLIVPFRNPIDSIPSWNHYPSNDKLPMDIKYYLRFYSEVINRLDRVVLFDFSKFTVDLDYIKTRVYENFFIEPLFETTIKDIQALMIESGKEINLPRNNKEELDKIKAELIQIPEFQDCIDLYNRLLELA